MPFGMPKGVAAHGRQWTPVALKAPNLLDFRHKKRRPWTSLDDEVVGRGNLNLTFMLLIIIINFYSIF